MKIISFLHKSKLTLDKEHDKTALYEIELANLARIRIMLFALLIIEIIFIVLNDIPNYFNLSTKTIWEDSGYFVLHLLLFALSIIGLVTSNKLIKIDFMKWKRAYSFFIPAILIIYLVLISLLDGLDSFFIGKISSIFIANLILCGGIFMIKFPKNLFTYAIPCLCHIVVFFYLGHEGNVLYANLINCIVFLLAIMMISTTIFHYQYEGIAKNIILDQTNNQLNYISSHDPLTGLLNRRCFLETIEMTQEGKLEQAAVILVDIDYFKTVNDKYGHPVGDMILKEVSSVLMEHIKDEDLAARWGGEEFLLFIHNTSAEEAYSLAEIIRKDIEDMMIKVNDLHIQTTASFGVAPINYENNLIFSSAYKAADLALYSAKDQGRNCVVKAAV